MTDIERRVEALETRAAVSELRSKYCWYTTRGDRRSVADLFTTDAIFQNYRSATDDPVTIVGREALHAHFERMRPARRIPMVMNEVTHITDAGVAEGTCVMHALGEDGFCGHYIDDFRKMAGTWLFARRRFFPYWPVFRPDADRPAP
jgi:predicted metallopeptidase